MSNRRLAVILTAVIAAVAVACTAAMIYVTLTDPVRVAARNLTAAAEAMDAAAEAKRVADEEALAEACDAVTGELDWLLAPAEFDESVFDADRLRSLSSFLSANEDLTSRLRFSPGAGLKAGAQEFQYATTNAVSAFFVNMDSETKRKRMISVWDFSQSIREDCGASAS